MHMKTSTIVWVIAVVAVLGVSLYFYSSSSNISPANPALSYNTNALPVGTKSLPSSPPSTVAGNNPQQNTIVSSSTVPMQATVTYGPNGFSPSTVTIRQGGVVTFVNQSSGKMWIGANPHPTHEGYDSTTKNQHCVSGYAGPVPFDQCSAGANYSFTFSKIGSWSYHNHANSSDVGTIVVAP